MGRKLVKSFAIPIGFPQPYGTRSMTKYGCLFSKAQELSKIALTWKTGRLELGCFS